jgi:hypothetical protein
LEKSNSGKLLNKFAKGLSSMPIELWSRQELCMLSTNSSSTHAFDDNRLELHTEGHQVHHNACISFECERCNAIVVPESAETNSVGSSFELIDVKPTITVTLPCDRTTDDGYDNISNRRTSGTVTHNTMEMHMLITSESNCGAGNCQQ